MPDQSLIDGLVSTYRVLNLSVRIQAEARLKAKAADEGASVREVVSRLRDDELRFSQALKARITGIEIPDIFGEDLPAIGTETADDSTNAIIAQFGTARESTLAMLRSMPDPDWDVMTEGQKSIRNRTQELLENDAKQLARISGLLGAR
ncbi:MAG: hypothetical protein ACR2OO_08270 [Thermomicrobiales bacterium]